MTTRTWTPQEATAKAICKMTRTITVLFLFLGIVAAAQSFHEGETFETKNGIVRPKQRTVLETTLDAGLPVLDIHTIGGEEPTCDYVYAPSGALGRSITNATKVPARAVIYEADGTISYDSGTYAKDVSGITIRIRGNNSAFVEKKPYKLKLQRKAALIDGSTPDKDWLLIKNDILSLNTLIGLKVNELIGMAWTPKGVYVNLILNDDYRGIYMLIESVNRNTSGRINVDSEEGRIFEWDPYWWNEDYYIEDSHNNKFTFKYPEPDKLSPAERDRMHELLDSIEDAIEVGNYARYLDIESFVNWQMAHDILGTYDGAGSNIYFTLYDDTSKVQMVTLWDFDTIERQWEGWSGIHYAQDFWFYRLFQSEDRTFALAYLKRWKEVSPVIFEAMEAWLEEYEQTTEFAGLILSYPLDMKRYNCNSLSPKKDIQTAKKWFATRREWMEAAISHQIDGIKAPLSTFNGNRSIAYDLQGRRIRKNLQGIYINNGRVLLSSHPL